MMKNNIYKKQFEVVKKPVDKEKLLIKKMEATILDLEKKIDEKPQIAITIPEKLIIKENEEVRKVEIVKQVEPLLPREVIITNPTLPPDEQKVKITNPEALKQEFNFPEHFNVTVDNPTQIPEFPQIVFPIIQKVEVINPFSLELPLGEANIPGKADPTKYLNVRLTNGKQFYKALDEMWVASGGKGGGSNKPALLGYPIPGQVRITVSGTAIALPDNALLNGVTLKAPSTNTSWIGVGRSNAIFQFDGTGNVDILEPGERNSWAVTNTNKLYIIGGTIGDIISFSGS